MNNILQWEPEKSRLWGNARIGNIVRLRADLGQLAELLKTKADSSALQGKADLAKLGEVERVLNDTRQNLARFQEQAGQTTLDFKQQLGQLDEWLRGIRESVDSHLQAVEQQAASAARDAHHATAAAEQAGASASQAAETREALQSRADGLAAEWEGVRQALTTLSATAEQGAVKVAEVAGEVRQALAECQAGAKECQELHGRLQLEQQQTRETISAWVRETEAHAKETRENSHLAAAGSELVSSLKSECEEIAQGVRVESERLSGALDKMRQDFSAWNSAAENDASRAAASAQAAEQAVSECQASLHAGQELKSSFKAEQDEIERRISALDEKLHQAVLQVDTSAEHLEACQRLHGQIVASETRFTALREQIEEYTRRTQQTRDNTEAIRQEVQKQLIALQLHGSSFFRRLKWLLVGNG